MLDKENFERIFPNAKDVDELYSAMEEMLPKYEINNTKRIAGFLAQCGHESGGFRVRTENLNYSAKALDAVFGKYFKKAGRDATEYERQPEVIANIVYADRMGNGDTESGDGWKHRGRGYIQLTGKNNYDNFASHIGVSTAEVIDYLDTVEGALESACWFWKENNLNKYADEGDVKGMTKRINGGYNGLKDREHHWEEILEAMGEKTEQKEETPKLKGLLKAGSRGAEVMEIQKILGVKPASGVFGPTTKTAVLNYQKEHGLTADGIVGPKTYAQMLK